MQAEQYAEWMRKADRLGCALDCLRFHGVQATSFQGKADRRSLVFIEQGFRVLEAGWDR